MKVLITGASGQLGLCIQDRFPSSWSLKATGHSQLDISNKEQIEFVIKSFQPNVIVNTAAYTSVDRAEQEPENANLVNHIGGRHLAELSTQYNIRLIHISTDYVFDGKKQTSYLETDLTNPTNVYGQTKLLGEQAILSSNPWAVILRTSWVFSEYGNNFVKTMLRLAKEKKNLSVVSDQFGCPTYAGDLAEVIITIIKRNNIDGGIYHYCGDSSVSWYEFSVIIFDLLFKHNLLQEMINLTALDSTDYKTLAIRPINSVLSCEKLHQLGFTSSNWRYQLELLMINRKF